MIKFAEWWYCLCWRLYVGPMDANHLLDTVWMEMASNLDTMRSPEADFHCNDRHCRFLQSSFFFLFLININFFFFIFFFHPIHSLPLLIYFHVPRFSKKNLRSGKSSGVNQMVKRRPACPHFFPVWICKYPSEMLKSNLIVGPLPPPTTFFFHLSLSLSLSVFRSTWGSKSNHTAVAFSVLSRERRKERWGRGRGGINRDRTGRRIKNKQETAIDE